MFSLTIEVWRVETSCALALLVAWVQILHAFRFLLILWAWCSTSTHRAILPQNSLCWGTRSFILLCWPAGSIHIRIWSMSRVHVFLRLMMKHILPWPEAGLHINGIDIYLLIVAGLTFYKELILLRLPLILRRSFGNGTMWVLGALKIPITLLSIHSLCRMLKLICRPVTSIQWARLCSSIGSIVARDLLCSSILLMLVDFLWLILSILELLRI